MLTMDLLRHGALEGGIKYRGTTDDALTPEGGAQMQRVWSRLAGEIDLIITSPLSRCAGPATAWATAGGIECIVEPAVMEMHYGDWEGKRIPEIQHQYPGMLEQWRTDPSGMCPPGGESPEAFRARLTDWWQDCCSRYDGRHLLLVSHSGVMRMLIAHVLAAPIGSSRHLSMPYGCWSRIACEKGHASLQFHQAVPG